MPLNGGACFLYLRAKKMIPVSIVPLLEKNLLQHTGLSAEISECRAIGGGSINDACKLQYGNSHFFVKWNDAGRYPGMFETEAKGLHLLKQSDALYIPEVIATAKSNETSFILMEYIEQGRGDRHFWEVFGTRLAKMHRHTADSFGLDHDNYIGSLPQYNAQKAGWPDFFTEQRLEPQLKMARDTGLADRSLSRSFQQLYNKMGDLFPTEPPALLHGDLWSGNYLCNSEKQAVLIDPAVYYGHREMDLGMSQLFGGFDAAFYTAYDAAWPLEKGWQQRLHLCNLYPLMVHVNLFGSGYLGQVKRILRHYV